MGIKHKGIPITLALELIKNNDLIYFVESGTGSGRTALWASSNFDYVWSIELDNDIHSQAKAKIASHCWRDNVMLINGNSCDEIQGLVEKIKAPALFFLDAHWSPDLGYRRPDTGECPVIAEILPIMTSPYKHIIIIDDARYFVERPGAGHRADDWPTFNEIKEFCRSAHKSIEYLSEHDVIVIK